jgi:hypothetical protein
MPEIDLGYNGYGDMNFIELFQNKVLCLNFVVMAMDLWIV